MNFKYYKTVPLIISILVLMFCVDYLCVQWLMPILEKFKSLISLRIPTNLAIVIAILKIYNNYLWKYPFFNLLVKVPDMNGRYEGKIEYTFENIDGIKDCAIEVKQTASTIKIHSYFNNDQNELTNSKSLIEDIAQATDGFFDVFILYHNSGSKKGSVLDAHDGANILRFFPHDNSQRKKLSGSYFTNRKIQTKGTIWGEFVSNKLKGEF